VVAAPASDAEGVTPPTASHRRPRLATVLAALTALALVGVVALGWWLHNADQEQRKAEQDRIAVMQASERFVETWNTFTPDDVDGYVDRVSQLLTTKFRTEFTGAAEDVVTGIEQQQLSSTGEVLVDSDGIPLVGIATLDPDSAEVLVVADANRVAEGQDVLRHWRWQVSLVKVDGEWLVDSFKEV
jgi:hypothetical protein